MAKVSNDISPYSVCVFATRIYSVALTFCSISIIQWLFIKRYDLLDSVLGDEPLSVFIVLASAIYVLINYFIDGRTNWLGTVLQFTLALTLVQVNIVGAAWIIVPADNRDIMLSITLLIIIMYIFSSVGGYMTTDSTVIFLMYLALWMSICFFGIFFLITNLLWIDIEFTPLNAFATCFYPIILFSLSCHARKINSLHYKRMTLADCMRSALLIYQKFVLLLIITLLLIKYDNADVDIKIEN